MKYLCEHGRRVIPRAETDPPGAPGGPEALETCAECPADRRQVRYRPVFEGDEGADIESQLRATLLHALKHARLGDWSR
jgi:hypothetical protein